MPRSPSPRRADRREDRWRSDNRDRYARDHWRDTERASYHHERSRGHGTADDRYRRRDWRSRSRSRSPPPRRRSRSRSVERGRHRRATPSSEEDSSGSESDERSRRHREKKHKHKGRDRSRSRSRDRSETREERRERKRLKKEKKEKKRAKKAAKSSKSAITEYGKYGIITEADYYSKDQEYRSWLIEEKMLNPETVPPHKMKELFRSYMEDYNTGTLPHEKFYALEAYERRMNAIKAGETVVEDKGYDPRADELALSSASRGRRAPGADTYLVREQVEELRRLERERVELSRMKRMGMDVKESLGVRYE